ncbi:putative RNA-directed DNA polymerase from transposon X-element [Stylophora pistillata]|uniref:Putative RNA-directed DNA polymerase from transposon X-element n=1 Tax=Stylophora pistillata TaxID=50429 RepID=A0A2B4SH45_STYPI|nr:putative RNA-directed DNA polymerase from transposon X-element [Stylophora pistillata]
MSDESDSEAIANPVKESQLCEFFSGASKREAKRDLTGSLDDGNDDKEMRKMDRCPWDASESGTSDQAGDQRTVSKLRDRQNITFGKGHKATGDDAISAKILKIAAPAVLPSPNRLLNLCISNKVFPSTWKVAKVTPEFKGNGSRSDCNSYRPILVLPVLSKVLERHICEHLCDFLTSNEIMYKLQSRFRKSSSTEAAWIRRINELLLSLDMENVTGLVMIDYKRAFDLLDHTLLLRKVRATGIDNDYVSLFESCLSHRTQYINNQADVGKVAQRTTDKKMVLNESKTKTT